MAAIPPGATAGAVPLAAPPVLFALNPTAAVQGVIDMGSVKGQKLYAAAMKPLEEHLYDVDPAGLNLFLKELNQCAVELSCKLLP